MIDREQRLADALAEYVDRQARGEAVELEAFCGRYPDLAAELREQVETISVIDQMVEGPVAQTPERLSGHRILGEIGAGGMGRVFLALDEGLGRKVAVKTLAERFRDNPIVRARFLQEARAMARVSHPHVVRIYNLGPAEEPPHFVMEYVEGVPLTQAAAPLTLRQKVVLMHKVALAVECLHQHQVIHRDLKPGNILVGPDLEPKVMDFGLALHVSESEGRLTRAGEVMGTPRYLSPEQARGEIRLDARSDVFSLGTVLYEVLAGVPPFRAENLAEQVRAICERDPELPRRIRPDLPGELQNICLQALEKNPGDRYGSAREMAADLERYLAGEPVLAAPASYGRRMAGKIEQHLRELEGWRQDQILSMAEYDALRKGYERLSEREDAWILEARRLSLPQVSLYLGGWLLIVGAALLVLFRYASLRGWPAVAVAAVAAVATGWLGIEAWQLGRKRIGVAYLLALCLLAPTALLVAMGEFGWLTAGPREKWEFFGRFESFRRTTNAQLWWALLLSLPAYYGLRRFTGSPVFSLVLSAMAALLCITTLLRLGMLEWLDDDPGKVYLRLIPVALLFFVAGFGLERRRHPGDSRYFYPPAVAFTWLALSGVAATHEPYAKGLQAAFPWTRGQVEYLFLINAGIYAVLQAVCDRLPSDQMRVVARTFRFVIPGHVLTSLWLLGREASQHAAVREARAFEILLPVVACGFVFASIPKQMKNYFATGMLFLAIGIVRLQQGWLKDRGVWPVTLLLAGLGVMLVAANYARVKMFLRR